MSRYIPALAELIVRVGANVQPDQMVSLSSEPGKEELARAVAEAAYRQGARFVDLSVFDLHLKHARVRHAEPATLSWVPPWYGQRKLALGECAAAEIVLSGPVAPGLMDDVDPELLGRDMLPRLRESSQVLTRRQTNWVVAPSPTPDWASMAFPELPPDTALDRLWEQIAHVCRLDTPDPVAAWDERLTKLRDAAARLSALQLDRLELEGPGTSLSIGLLSGTRWTGARLETVGGIVHVANLPTEEVFTTPDPERVEGYVRATKPLVNSGTVIRDLEVRFQRGRIVDVAASHGAGTFRALAARDDGASRLGEVALVDREGRVGPLGTIFYDTLLDENAASHLAIGDGFEFVVDEPQARERINRSEIHVDFMVGSDELAVTGYTRAGERVALLRGGRWQI